MANKFTLRTWPAVCAELSVLHTAMLGHAEKEQTGKPDLLDGMAMGYQQHQPERGDQLCQQLKQHRRQEQAAVGAE
jgi:hypothetical protein